MIVLSAIPGLGTFAYLAARPLRSNRLLLRTTADALLQKTLRRLYERTGLRRLIARPASSPAAGIAGSSAPQSHTGGAGRLLETAAAAPECR